MRISIVGLPASGKSTLARQISEKLAIPHIHIDRFWFSGGGRRSSHDTPNLERVRLHVREQVLKAITNDSWVSDGFYSRIQNEISDRADIVVFLNVPLGRRLLNHLERIMKRETRHGEISFWDDIVFFVEIVKRTYTKRDQFENFLAMYRSKITTLTSRNEINYFVVRLPGLEPGTLRV